MPFCGRSTRNYNAFLAGTPIYTQRGHMASILLPREEPCFRAGRARRGDFDAAYFVWVTSSLHFHCASVIRGIVAFADLLALKNNARGQELSCPFCRSRVRILRRGPQILEAKNSRALRNIREETSRGIAIAG